MGLLVFGFGLAAGFLAAFLGLGFLADSASVVIAALLVALLVAGLAGLALVLLRKRLMQKLFGFAEAEVDRFSTPLGRVADAAIARDPLAASEAARELVQLSLARYAWVSTRRWVVASLTALIAAMAALGGTALLFKQNELIATQLVLLEGQNGLISSQLTLMQAQNDQIGAQLVLMEGQNQRIDQQTRLLSQDVELAEAARSAELTVEVTQIVAEIGDLATAANAERAAEGFAPEDDYAKLVNALDPTQLPSGLVQRIVATSRALRPYRFLDSGYRPADDAEKAQRAMMRRREHLPETYARMAAGLGWRELPAGSELIDRPASPERGQMFTALAQGGVRNLELFNHFGLDMSFAWLTNATILMVTMQGGQFSYADFSGVQMNSCDLGGAFLENSRFRRANIRETTFAALDDSRVLPPWPKGTTFPTQLTGADFDGSVLVNVAFSGINGLGVTFEDAALMRPDFTGASLAAGSFAGAVLIAPVWDGADLRSTEFDGAILFGEDVLGRIAAAAAPGTFKPENFAVEPITLDEVLEVRAVYLTFSAEEITAAAGGSPVRVKRVAGREG